MAGAPAGARAAAPTGDSGAATGAARRAALLAAVAVVLAGNVVALWPTPAGRSITLIDQLADATIESSWPSIRQGIAVQLVTIHAPVFRAMVALPVSRVAWTVDVPRGAFLRGGAAMRADVWRAPSDGANLSVYVEAATGRTLVAQYTLAPYLYEHHRNLFPLEVPLEPWAGQAVTLAFETDPERWGNFVNDVPVWVEPRIEWPRGTAWGEARVHAR